MPIKLILLLSTLIGLVFAAAPPAATKGKAPAAKATASSKAKAPAKTAAKTSVSTAKTGKAPAASKQQQQRTTATVRRPATNSKAVYSRTNSSRYGRGQTAAAARRGSVPVRSQSSWQARPSPERYREIQQALADKGFFKGEVDGTWSTSSVNALKDFQRAQNLEPDGKLGSLSLIALGLGPKRIVAANPNPPPTPLPAPATPQQQQQQQPQPSPPAQNPIQP